MSNDREFLYELSLILDNAETDQNSYGIDNTRFINLKIEVNTARDTALRLRMIANRQPEQYH